MSTRKWRLSHPEKYAIQKWRYHLKHTYGMTVEQYDAMTFAQGGLCAICKKLPTVRSKKSLRLDVDHNHETGEIRGLLCSTCNTALHKIEHDEKWAAAAKAYLSQEKKKCLHA
jgi:hypothetical protein